MDGRMEGMLLDEWSLRKIFLKKNGFWGFDGNGRTDVREEQEHITHYFLSKLDYI